MRPFSKKSDILEDPKVPYEQVEQRGSKEISKYDEEYQFLVKLIKLVVSEGVPPAEVRDLARSYPFVTIDDAGDLAAKIWTLATQKYKIPSEWLQSKLPKNASLKIAALGTDDRSFKQIIKDYNISRKTQSFDEVMDFVTSYFQAEWGCETPADVNSGMCRDWANFVKLVYPEAKVIHLSLNTGEHGYFHTILEYNGKFYDSEAPHGVASVQDLPISNFVRKNRPDYEGIRDVKLPNLKADHLDPIDTRREYNKKEIKKVEPSFSSVDRLEIEDPFQDIENQRVRFPKKKADLWPAQEQAGDMLSHEHNSLSYNNEQEADTSVSGPRPDEVGKISKKLNINDIVQMLNAKEPQVANINPKDHTLQLTDGTTITFDEAVKRATELDKEGVFSGAEFSTDDFGINPSMDIGPFSSPEDQGARDQKQPFPNTDWLPADDINEDEQPYSDVASSTKRPFSKKAAIELDHDILVTAIEDYVEALAYDDAEIKAFYASKEYHDMVMLSTLEELEKRFPNVAARYIGYSNAWEKFGPGGDEDEVGDYLNQNIPPLPSAEDTIKELPTLDKKDKMNQLLDQLNSTTDEMQKQKIMQQIKRLKLASLRKKANPSTRYWIAPDGTEFPVAGIHPAWIKNNFKILKKYGINPANKTLGDLHDEMISSGWIRVSNEPAGSGFHIEVRNVFGLPSFLDNFVAKNFTPGDTIVIGNSRTGGFATLTDPFPTLQKAVQKSLRANASLKQADLSSQTVNQILNAIHQNGGATFNLSHGDLSGTDNYAVSIYPDRSEILDGVDFDSLEEYILKNEDLLNNSENSFGAWTNNGHIYLDVVATIPDRDKAIELGKQHNQIAIWDLKNNKEISTGGTGEAVEAFINSATREITAEEILCQEDQNQIAADSSPAYVIAVNNYAEALKRGHEKDRSLQYAIESVANLEKISEKKLVELINTYL